MSKESFLSKQVGGERKLVGMSAERAQSFGKMNISGIESFSLKGIEKDRTEAAAERTNFETSHDAPLSTEATEQLDAIDAEMEAAWGDFEAEAAPYVYGDSPATEQAVPQEESEVAPVQAPETASAPIPSHETQTESSAKSAEVYEEFSPLSGSLQEDPAYVAMSDALRENRPDKYGSELGEAELRRNYEREHPERFALYQKQEAGRIYRDDTNAPKLENDPTYQQFFKSEEYGGFGLSSDLHGTMQANLKLIAEYPEKAKAYAETDERLKRMLEDRTEH